VKVKQSLSKPGQARTAAGVFVDCLNFDKTYIEDEKRFDDQIIFDFLQIDGSKYSP
jgi:hypothetical protein